MELAAGMGEWVVSDRADDVLSCIGLGSCIGLAVVDRRAGVAGLAHVMLPESPAGGTVTPGKYADLAVPALLRDVEARGASRLRLAAVVVGGAQMFKFAATQPGSARDIGRRNEAAVREQLSRAGVAVFAHATGGDRGRSMKVYVQGGEVTCREAAGETVTILSGHVDAAVA